MTDYMLVGAQIVIEDHESIQAGEVQNIIDSNEHLRAISLLDG
jgi:hypothetical protein